MITSEIMGVAVVEDVVGRGVVVVVVVVLVDVVVVVASVVVDVVVVVVEVSGAVVNSEAIVTGSGEVSGMYLSVLASGCGVERSVGVVVLVDRFWNMWLISGIDTRFLGVS